MLEQPYASPGAPTTPTPSTPTPTTGGFNAALPKRKLPLKMILGVIAFVLLLAGAGAAYYLTQVNQDVRQQASSCVYGSCGSSGQTQCTAQGKTLVCIGGCWQNSGNNCTPASPVVGPTTMITCWSSSCTSLKTTAATCPSNFSTTKPLVCATSGSGCGPGQVSTGCSGFLKN